MAKEDFWDPIKKGMGDFFGDMFGPMGIGPRSHSMKDRMYPAWNDSRKNRKNKTMVSKSPRRIRFID